MADGGHHSEGAHKEDHAWMQGMSGARFVVVLVEAVLGCLEAVLNSPAAPFALNQPVLAPVSRALSRLFQPVARMVM